MNEAPNLLQAYVTQHSETAFAELVRRYVDLVYSAAVRQCNGDTHLAQDITQTVFADLAIQASRLDSKIQLGGWLHRHTCYVAANLRRAEQRRQRREARAMEDKATNSSDENTWQSLAPELDQAINGLSAADRSAIIMRFFEQRNHREIGEVLKTTEDTAQKRVSRALEKLRTLLAQRGVALSLTVLAGLLSDHALSAAPTDLSKSIRPEHPTLHSPTLPPSQRGLVLAGLAAAIMITLFLLRPAPDEASGLAATDEGSRPTQNPGSVPGPENPTPSPLLPVTPPQMASTGRGQDQVKLIIQSAETGERIPGVRLRHRAQLQESWDVKDLTANRAGEITIPFDLEELKMLQLITKVNGFTDTRLEWHPARGDIIPAEVTLSLGPATRIGGRVLDLEGNPIANARVGFNHEDSPAMRTRPQSYEFSWIEVKTDETGRWEINRIANEILPLIYGSAWHKEYTSSELEFVSRDRSILQALKAGTHEFRLASTVGLTGFVVDEQNQPIPDADVTYGYIGSGSKRSTTTDLEGRFVLTGCSRGSGTVTASAPAFAPYTVRTTIAPDSPELTITLKAGKELRLQIVDREDSPIEGATVWYDSFDGRHSESEGQAPWVQYSFKTKTDPNGLATWPDAPDRELSFDIHAKGYMRQNDVKTRPGIEPYLVTLLPALTITGTIVDEDTGEPIDQARIVTGWANPNAPAGEVMPNWSSLGRFWIDFTGGTFEHTYEEPVVLGIEDLKFILRFEAEGYTSKTSRAIAADEGTVNLEIQLQPSDTQNVTVYRPDGSPAVQADVALIRKHGRVTILPGSLAKEGRNSNIDQLMTDALGQFKLQDDPELISVLVVDEAGFFHSDLEVIRASQSITLEPWGRVEGQYAIPVEGNETITVSIGFEASRHRGIFLGFEDYQAKLTDEGRFEFSYLPPGRHRLAVMEKEDNTPRPSWSHRPIGRFEILPGETTEVFLQGHLVSFDVERPLDMMSDRMMGELQESAPVDTNESGFHTLLKRFPLKETANGSWQNQRVTPGHYVAIFGLYRSIGGRVLRVAQCRAPVTVAQGDQPIRISVPAKEWNIKIPILDKLSETADQGSK